MEVKNISKQNVGVAGRIVEAGMTINMKEEYYDKRKKYVDDLVDKKLITIKYKNRVAPAEPTIAKPTIAKPTTDTAELTEDKAVPTKTKAKTKAVKDKAAEK